MSQRTIRIGGASGFWGDTTISTPQLLRGGNVDYLVYDYLAEVTMSIMARARAKNPALGFAVDFVGTIAANLEAIASGGIRVIANAGGMNPIACAKALEAEIAKAGFELKVGVVSGDDVLDRVADWRARGVREMYNGAAMPDAPLSANAYLGALPIAAALDAGAHIVVTGRCVDSALTLGACIHAFAWSADDLDRLAGGSLAGHIIECGAQACGGLHTDWETTGDWSDIGFPIAEIGADGSFELTKPCGTGGVVRFGTVAEQLLYEIGDPQRYVLPDLVCDFSNVRIEETGVDRVRVSGAKGYPPTSSYKVSVTYQDGYRVGQYLTIGGIDAVRKAQKVATDVIRRCERLLEARGLPAFAEISIEVIGSEGSYGDSARGAGSREVVLKLAARHVHEKPLELLVRELTSSATSMAPGICGLGGNRPKVSPVVRLFSCLVPKNEAVAEVSVAGTAATVAPASARVFDAAAVVPPAAAAPVLLPEGGPMVPLVALAYGRSGDKGDDANIGIIARRAAYLPFIRAALTPEHVRHAFAHFLKGEVERFDLPGINGLNFLLHSVLGGGGTASLRNDPQGKAYAQILLDSLIPVTPEIAADAGAATAQVPER